MVTITRAETEDGTRLLTVRAKTGQEAVAAIHALRLLDAQVAAGESLSKAIEERRDERTSP